MSKSKQFPQRQKPRVGKLWYNEEIIMEDKPFPFLQAKKKKLIATGRFKKNLFKITY